jgi:hypothetical protein
MENRYDRREPNHDKDGLQAKYCCVHCEGGASGITSQTSMKPDELENPSRSNPLPHCSRKSVTLITKGRDCRGRRGEWPRGF